jgi:hypothetical protein
MASALFDLREGAVRNPMRFNIGNGAGDAGRGRGIIIYDKKID